MLPTGLQNCQKRASLTEASSLVPASRILGKHLHNGHETGPLKGVSNKGILIWDFGKHSVSTGHSNLITLYGQRLNLFNDNITKSKLLLL